MIPGQGTTTGKNREPTLAKTTDVAIIGGGAAGCAVAYYLAQSGVNSTIIEREGIGNQASGNAAGGLNPLTLSLIHI